MFKTCVNTDLPEEGEDVLILNSGGTPYRGRMRKITTRHDFKSGDIVMCTNPYPDIDGDVVLINDEGAEQFVHPSCFLPLGE